MYKQRLADPYRIKNGVLKTVFNLRNKAGVYMIYKNTELLYVGYSGSDVYKALYRHFQQWNDKTQIRVQYNPNGNYKVRLIYCNSSKQADTLEKALILKYKPKDNPNKYDLYEADESEKKVFSKYKLAESKPIAEFKSDVPF